MNRPAQDPPSLSELIAELRRSQAELEAQNEALRYSRIAAEGASERFESLFSNVPLALMVVDELGMIAQSNAMALQQFRPRESDPELNFLLPLVEPQHTARVEAALAAALREGRSELSEVAFRRGLDGGTLTGDLHIARIEYSQDELAHFICAVIDQGPLLAERRALQERHEALRLSEHRLAAIIDSSLDAIVCIDDSQRIRVFNPAAVALFGCPAESALGTPLARFLPQVIGAIAATPLSARALLGEVAGQTADGRPLELEVSVSRERHAQGDLSTVFARDLTGRKAMEQRLRESQKMQAMGTLAGGIAHDFNNILGAILGNATLARMDAPADAPVQVCLAEIEKAGRRARELVRQVLTFSRSEAPRRQPLRLDDLVQDCVRLLQVTLPPRVALRTQVDPALPAVLADPTQVEQALLNLCTNAIHAVGADGGTVEISLAPARLDATRAAALELPAGDYLTLAVRDTGRGMDEATRQRIFEPFFTTKPVDQGTGLGLSVVHGVMRAHQGAVQVASQPGAGSTFTLYFPALAAPAVAAAQAPASAIDSDAAPLRGRVLYVDDDQALVFLVQRVLTRQGLQVTTFTDPLAALAELRARPADFDLLVTDYNMPGYSGVELLRAVQSIRADLPVALASGYVTPEIEHEARAAGARALIHKPDEVDALCDTVRRLLLDDARG